MRFATARLLAAISLGVIFLSVLGFLLPTATLWRANSLYAMIFAIGVLFVIRLILTQSAGAEAFRRRILVLGAGPRAARIPALAETAWERPEMVCFAALAERTQGEAARVHREGDHITTAIDS